MYHRQCWKQERQLPINRLTWPCKEHQGALDSKEEDRDGCERDVTVEFLHCIIDCYHYQLRLHTENEQKAITDGLPPKRLWSAIDHTGESPGPPESKKVQAKQDHGQADGGCQGQRGHLVALYRAMPTE